MKITIDTNDESIAGVIESLKLVADTELNPTKLEEHSHWLKHVSVTDNAGPMELTLFRFNNLEV